MELCADAGANGKYFSRCRGTVLVVGVIFSVKDYPYSKAVLLDALNEEADGRAAATISRLKECFRRLAPRIP